MILSYRSIASLLLLFSVVIFGFVGSLILGDLGHNFNEKMNLINALYFTIITLSTVGYGDIVPTTPIAKIFVISLIVLGMGAFLTALTSISGDVASRRIISLSNRLAMFEEEMIKGNILLIGSGNVNVNMAEQLKSKKEKYVMLVSDTVMAEKLNSDGFRVYTANLLSEEEMRRFHVDKARMIIIDVNDPSDALYSMLIVAELAKNSKIIVIVHSSDLEKRVTAVSKMFPNVEVVNPSKRIAGELISA
ncbi:hypothetical protein HS7_00110 [Sulfolobales archaeon HS-7]|nr:hypothetical protein HS7_00110 [Sulfolobales archaeon HS-7]